MSIVLYDLAGADPDVRFSPYCWRTRFALAHKGLPVETVPWRFTERDAIAFSGQGKVPVIQDDGKVVSDSWAIAEYLDERYPAVRRCSVARWAVPMRCSSMAGPIRCWSGESRGLLCANLIDTIDPKDRDYFRSSREARFGKSLEAVQEGREERLSAFRETLLPIRLVLRRQAWLGGAAPSYADHIVAGTLMWPRCASQFVLLEANDLVQEWHSRVLDLYGGIGRSAERV